MKAAKKLCLVLIIALLAMCVLASCESEETVTVTFVVDGDPIAEYKIAKGADFTEEIPAVPEKEFYVGTWSVTNFEAIKSNLTVTAQYTQNYFTASFYVDGKLIRAEKVIYGTTPDTLPAIPAKEGYTASWSITDFTEYTTDKTVNAVYTPKIMTVTFKADGETVGTREVAYASSLTDFPSVPVVAGYVGSWGDTDFSDIRSSLTVNAVYTPEILKVTLVGADSDTTELNDVLYDTEFSLPSTQTKDGFVFEGWYVDNSYKLKAQSGIIRSSVSYYARWIEENAFDEGLFEFSLLADGTYELSAKQGATMPEELILPNVYEGKLVTKIADAAFSSLALLSVSLPEALAEIGERAFSDCNLLEKIIFPSFGNIKIIGKDAFKNNSKIESFTLTETIEEIGAFAFYGCERLTYFTVPQKSALKAIGESAFEGCRLMSGINVSERISEIGKAAFKDANVCIFNFEGLDLITAVGESAFENCMYLRTFSAPNILSVGKNAFAGCRLLAELTVPGNVPVSAYFGSTQFVGGYLIAQQVKINGDGEYSVLENEDYTEAVESKYIPGALKTVRISEGAVRLADFLLSNCFSVHTVHIPASVAAVGRYAFAVEIFNIHDENSYMSEKGKINFAEGSYLKEIGDYAFQNKTNFLSITLPAELRSIGSYAFSYATVLSDIVFLDGDALEYVGRDAFTQTLWKSLQPNGVIYAGNIAVGYNGMEQAGLAFNMTFSDTAIAIAPYAFANTHASNFNSLTVNGSIRSIGEYAFYNCSALLSVTVADGVESIGEAAFGNCSSLRDAVLPKGILSIGQNIFNGCVSLGKFTYFGDRVIGAFFGSEGYAGAYAAMQDYCEGKPYTISEIEDDVYSYSFVWTHGKNGNGELPLSYTITVKGVMNQEGESQPPAVYNVDASTAADGKISLKIQYLQGTYGFYRLSISGEGFYLASDKVLTEAITVTANYGSTYYLPDALTRVFVADGDAALQRVLVPNAFKNMTALAHIVLGEGITVIGEGAFENCIGLVGMAETVLYLTLPDGITEIGERAFKNASRLREVRLGEALGRIGEGAFEGSGLTELLLPASLTEIAAGAFKDTRVLSLVTFTDGEDALSIGENAFFGAAMTIFRASSNIEYIGENAFSNNQNLSSVVFKPDSRLTHLGEFAFSNNTRLVSAVFPSSLDLRLVKNVFVGSYAVTELTFYSDTVEETVLSVGRLFSDTQTDVDIAYAVTQNGEAYYVPSGFSRINYYGGVVPSGMFENLTGIRQVQLSEVAAIGERAFAGCVMLAYAVLPDSVKTIGDEAFLDCEKIISYEISSLSLLESIGKAAFKNNSLLEGIYIPSGVKVISESTFENALAMESVSLPSLTKIMGLAFKNCVAVKEIALPETLEYIGAEAFYNCIAAAMPYANLDRLTEVGGLAFYNCIGLTFFRADNIEKLGVLTFDGATSIKELTLPQGISIGELFGSSYYEKTYQINQGGSTFRIPSSLKTVRISARAMAVAASAMENCIGIEEVVFLSENPPSIGTAALSLGRALSVYVPLSNADIYTASLASYINAANGDRLFTHPSRSELLEYTLKKDGTYAVSANKDIFEAEAVGSVIIPADYEGVAVTEILGSGFAGLSTLERIIIPSSVATVGVGAFMNASSLSEVRFEPGSLLAEIGNQAFYGCVSIKSIIIPEKVVRIGNSAFSGLRFYNDTTFEYEYTSGLESVTFEKGSSLLAIGENAFAMTANLKKIELPASLETFGKGAFSYSGIEYASLNIAVIPERAFASCLSLKEIRLGNDLFRIGVRAFEDCVSLESASLYNVQYIGERAFSGAASLSEISVSSVLEIGEEAFAYNSSLLKVVLPATVQRIMDRAFFGCTALSEVSIGNDSLEYLGNDAFGSTPWLSGSLFSGIIYINGVAYLAEEALTGEVVLRDGTTAVAARAFSGTAVTKITLPASVKKIGSGAFANIATLKEVEIATGSMLKEIESDAFSSSGLQTINLPDALTLIGANAFKNTAVALSALPTGLKEIGEGAFENVSGLTGEIVIPVLTEKIGGKAFADTNAQYIIPSQSNITEIGDLAFENAIIESIAFPARLTALSRAFAGAEIIEELVLSDGLLSIGSYAFENTTVSKIVIGSNSKLFSIGDYAFAGLSATDLGTLSLRSLSSVGKYAFSGCVQLSSFFAPNITAIGEGAFNGCTALESLSVLGTSIRSITDNLAIAELNIASGVVSIRDNAFSDISSSTINIPAAVRYIGKDAFKNSASLDIVFEQIVAVTDVGTGAFSGTYWLEKQAEGIVYVGRIVYAYKGGVSSSVSIASGTVKILPYAFAAAGITSVSLPTSLEAIGDGAFSDCEMLSVVTIAPGGSLSYVGDGAFKNCNLKTVDFPSSVTYFGEECLAENALLHTVKYSASVKLAALFGEAAFDGSYQVSYGQASRYIPESLASVYIVDGASIVADGALDGFASVNELVVSSGVTEIGARAFANMTELVSVIFISGSVLQGIGSYAFMNATSLVSVFIPATVTAVGEGIFDGCASLEKVSVNGVFKASSLFSGDAFASFRELEIAEGTVEIAADAYRNTVFASLVLPSSLVSIGSGAFAGNTALVYLQIKEGSLAEIGSQAFMGCTALTELSLGQSLREIGSEAFSGCTLLSTVEILSDGCVVASDAFASTAYYSSLSGWVIIGSTLMSYRGMLADKNVVIPDGITEIADGALKNQYLIESVTVASSVKRIGNQAFFGCELMETVLFAESSQLESIGSEAFASCRTLSSINLPAGVTEIGDSGFKNAASLTELTLPSALVKIGADAFMGSVLTTVVIPTAVEEIGDGAFSGLAAAITAALPKLIKIGERAFYNCTGLASFVAGAIEEIGNQAFYGCTGLDSLTLAPSTVLSAVYDGSLTVLYLSDKAESVVPSIIGQAEVETVVLGTSVTEICDGAFAGNTYVKYVYGTESVKTIGKNAFAGCTALLASTEDEDVFVIGGKVLSVDEGAFAGAVGLRKISLENAKSLSYIGSSAFASLTETEFDVDVLPALSYIGQRAFENCLLLTGFDAPALMTVGEYAFSGCAALETLTVVDGCLAMGLFGDGQAENELFYAVSYDGGTRYAPLSLTSITAADTASTLADYALFGMSSVTGVSLNNIKSVGSYAMAAMTGLTALTLAPSVASVSENAFSDELADITFENTQVLSYIGRGAFDNTAWYKAFYEECTDGIIYLGRVAYSAKGALTGVLSVNEGTLSITDFAFTSLSGITSVVLPLSLNSIGYGVLSGCSSVSSVSMPGIFTLGSLFGSDTFEASYAVTQQGTEYYIPLALKQATVKKGSLFLVDEAFKDCFTLENVAIEVGITAGSRVLSGCYGINTLTVDGKNTLGLLFGSTNYANSYAASQNGSEYYIPTALKSILVLGEEVAAHSFENTSSATRLDLESTVLRIGEYAFMGCTELLSFSIPEAVQYIGKGAFKNCTALTAMTVPSGATVSDAVFEGCSRLASLSINANIVAARLFGSTQYQGSYQVSIKGMSYYVPNTLVTVSLTGSGAVADYALSGFVSVANLTLPSETARIGAYAFYSLQNLLTVNIPATVVEIGAYAFYGCVKAEFVLANNNIERVGEGAFSGCERLSGFNSEAVVYIGDEAFFGCIALTTVTLHCTSSVDKVFGERQFAYSVRVTQTVDGQEYAFYLPSALTTVTVVGDGNADFSLLEGTGITTVDNTK